MCGIAGIVSFDGVAPDWQRLQRMTDVIAHRGKWISGFGKNSRESFVSALTYGFGIETDLRAKNN